VHPHDAVPGDFSRPIDEAEGEADFGATFRALDDIGHSGGFTLEQPSRAYVDGAAAVARRDPPRRAHRGNRGNRPTTHPPARRDGRPAAGPLTTPIDHPQGASMTGSTIASAPQSATATAPEARIQLTAVITGAASERGIGMAVADRYAREGWAIVILDLDGDRAAQVAGEIGGRNGVPAFGTAVNVADEAAVAAAHAAVQAEVDAGRLPIVGALANIAGITSPVPFLETTLELWNKVMAVNATGTYLVTKAFLPGMLDAGWGRIVNMSSVSAQRGGGVFGKVPYSAAKAAILGFTKALAREIADSGVTVNSVTPGAADTNIRVGATPESEANLAADIPIGRVATTDEIAAVFTFLSSRDAAYLQGANIDINGASHLH
jgi:NAD(P)-dependent dehydrogenase (short-subunit alcohol dehydrogenase family)